MKMHSLTATCLAVVIAAPVAQAIQPPADDAPPPPHVEAPEARPAPEAMPLVPGAAGDGAVANEPRPGFLGVIVEDVPESLAAHLEIPNGQGALIRQITPGSPAEKAGLQVHDILLKAAGKPVNGGPSVSEIVASKNAGEELELELLRKGEKQLLRIVLDARPAGLMGQAAPGFDDAFLENLPQDQAARIRDMIERNLRAMRDPGDLGEDEEFQDAFRGMAEQMERMLNDVQAFEAPPAEQAGGFGRLRMNAGTTVRLMDNEGSVEIKSVDGGKEVVVRDNANKIIWAGPWDTPQDKAAAPDDVRARIERLNIEGFQGGNGLKLRMFDNR